MVVDKEEIEGPTRATRKLLLNTDYARGLVAKTQRMLLKNHDAETNAKTRERPLEMRHAETAERAVHRCS